MDKSLASGFTIFFLFILVNFYSLAQEKELNNESQSYWNTLRKFPGIITLKFHDQHSEIKLDLSKKGDTAGFSRQAVKRLGIKMRSIKKLLEDCSVGEAVRVNIFTSKGKSIINIGTFFPTIRDQKRILFKIPKTVKPSISFLQLRQILLEYVKNKKDFTEPIACRMQFSDQLNRAQAELSVSCSFYIQMNSVYKPFFNLLKKELIHESGQVCNEIVGMDQTVCYCILADYLFSKKNFDLAGHYYSLSNEQSKLKEIADLYLQQAQYEKSMDYYEKLQPSFVVAQQLGKLGNIFKKRKKKSLAKICFQKAIYHFKFLLKSFLHTWDDEYFKYMRLYIQSKKLLPRSSEEEEELQTKLKILKNTAEYCQRLKKSSFLFFCTEEINEIKRGNRNRYVYDYQLIKEGEDLKESKKQINQNNLREVGGINYENKYIIFGPNGLISTYWQDYHDYEILEEVKIEGEPFFIVEAIPIFPLKVNNLYGKLWISSKDYSILKIQWYGKSLSNYKQIEEYAFKRGLKPCITFYTEFGIQKNGIRFPTKHYLEEAYLNKYDKKNIKSRTIVLYKDYHFFYVEADVVSVESTEKNIEH